MPRRTRTSRNSKADDELFANKGRSDDDSDGGSERSIPKPDGGWDAFKQYRDQARTGGDFLGKDDFWKPSEEETLVKFLDDAPFSVYYDIWVPARNRSYSTLDPENPLTERLGLKPQTRVLFNVLLAEGDEDAEGAEAWVPRVLRASTMLAELIEKMANHERYGPLTKGYWDMSATGTKKNYTPVMNYVKPRDLEEDWGLQPLSDDDLASFEVASREQVYIQDDDELLKIARELAKD